MILVKIIKGEPGLAAGEDRYLPDDIARRLIASGVAADARGRDGKSLDSGDKIEAVMKPSKKRGGYETK